MLNFSSVVRMIFAGNSSLYSKIIGLIVYIIAEAAFVAFLAWVFFTFLWYLDN